LLELEITQTQILLDYDTTKARFRTRGLY